MKRKNHGFTLVEVLGILVILGVVALLAFPAVDRYLTKAREEMYNTHINNIILSAKHWGSDNATLLPENNGQTFEITLGFLIDEGYVDYKITNPKTKKPMSKESKILITKNGNKYNYEFLEK